MIWALLFVTLLALTLFGPADPYADRPASHAMHHVTGEGPDCGCER